MFLCHEFELQRALEHLKIFMGESCEVILASLDKLEAEEDCEFTMSWGLCWKFEVRLNCTTN